MSAAADNAYGSFKRLKFCAEVLAQVRPKLVVDVGCGTGSALTQPLAESAPDTHFVGIDSDDASLEYARGNSPPANLTYSGVEELRRYAGAELIIASEVLEHVEDPEVFLSELRALLSPSGQLLLTVPNGWGPFEIATLLETLLRFSGIFGVLRRMKHLVADRRRVDPLGEDTLAVSPHLHFFSWRQLRNLFARSGLAVRTYRPRTFLCGFVLDPLLTLLGLLDWNARVADRLPPQLVSDWMFVLEPAVPLESPTYRRGAFNQWRRRLNEKRWEGASNDACLSADGGARRSRRGEPTIAAEAEGVLPADREGRCRSSECSQLPREGAPKDEDAANHRQDVFSESFRGFADRLFHR